MEPEKLVQLKEYLTNTLKTAKKLGLQVTPGGGYSMSYDINNLPPYPVGLFGALSIVEGAGARCKLGLTFEQTESLEAGFNGCMPNTQNKKKKKRVAPDPELMRIGAELTSLFQSIPRRPTSRIVLGNAAPVAPAPWDDQEAYAPKKKKKSNLEIKIEAEKKKIGAAMGAKLAQAAPADKKVIMDKMMAFAEAVAADPAIIGGIKIQEQPNQGANADAIWKMAVQWEPANQWGPPHPVNPHGEQDIGAFAPVEMDEEE